MSRFGKKLIILCIGTNDMIVSTPIYSLRCNLTCSHLDSNVPEAFDYVDVDAVQFEQIRWGLHFALRA